MMNDVLKWISRAITPMGYHVRPRTAPNFLKVPALERPENQENLTALRKASAMATPHTITDDLNHLQIYIRTCLRSNRQMNPKPRLTGNDIAENAYRCLSSLTAAIRYAQTHAPDLNIHLILMDDRSDSDILNKTKEILEKSSVSLSVFETQETGQGASLRETFAKGRGANALTYFVEEDYLHEEDAILCMWRFYKHMANAIGSHLVIYPQEHPELYSNHYPSYIVAGEDRHWRTTRNATHTFWTHGAVVDKFWPLFENTKFVGIKKHRRKGSEDRTTNRLFETIPGFSPLKPCAVHLQYAELLPPFYDWHSLWDRNKVA